MHPVPVFVINMKRDTERLAFMQKQLDKINISFEVIPGVDGASISRKRLARKQAGCLTAHINAWRTIVDRDLPAALILEDDVLLDDDFPEIFRNLRLPEECQILQVGSMSLRTHRQRIFSPYGAMFLPHGWKMACRPMGENYGTQGYIIRREMARRLLREENRLLKPVDYVLFFWRFTFYPPWIIYKKKNGAYATLGEEKRDWGGGGGASFAHNQKRRYIAKRIKAGLAVSRMFATATPAQAENLPVLVIHLKKDAQRLEAMRRRFNAMGVSFETVEAVDGNRIPAQTLRKMYDGKRARRKIKRELSPAEIGRCLSHAKAWRAFLKLDAPAAVIVEDNAVPDDDFPKFIKHAGDWNDISDAREGAGVFAWKLAFSPPLFPVSLPHKRHPPDDEEIEKLKAYEAVHRFQTQAYIVDRSRARYLLRKGRRIQRPVDDLLFGKKDLRRLVRRGSKIIFWDSMTLLHAHVLCRIFPPTRTDKFSHLVLDNPDGGNIWQDFKAMLSCYSFSRPFGLNLIKRKTGKSAQE